MHIAASNPLSFDVSENTLLNQVWIMDPNKKVSDILKENSVDSSLKIIDFIRYKVGEGV